MCVKLPAPISTKFTVNAVLKPVRIVTSRDLYKRARAGEIPDFTGISSPYEEPEFARLDNRH